MLGKKLYLQRSRRMAEDNNEYFVKVEVYHYQHASSTEHRFINAPTGQKAFIKAKEEIKTKYSNQGDSWRVTGIALLDIHRL